jgi:integrase
VRRDSAGRETWYGKWWVGTAQVKRRIGPKRVPATGEGLVAHMTRKGSSAKTIRNALGVLHGVFEYARRQEWVIANPVSLADKPRVPGVDPDIHFLETEEVEALLRGVPDDYLGGTERVMYLAAAMTGMRQGELLALRWRDVDWQARRVRIRRNFVRGEFGTPKSKRSSRSVPLADRLAAELDRLHRETRWSGSEDLVFAHPHTGKPIDRFTLLKRFKKALARAGVRLIRFHDLRHTFGTRLAAQGVPMRTLQEMMGHRDFRTTLIYADYAPSAHEAEWVEAAFRSPTSELAIGGRPGEIAEEPSDSGGGVEQPLDRPLEARGLIVE